MIIPKFGSLYNKFVLHQLYTFNELYLHGGCGGVSQLNQTVANFTPAYKIW